MNLVMREVLPTDCSPRNTSLNLRSGLPKSPEVDMVAEEGGVGGLDALDDVRDGDEGGREHSLLTLFSADVSSKLPDRQIRSKKGKNY